MGRPFVPFFCVPSTVVSFIWRRRVGCWALMSTPAERPHGTPTRTATERENGGITRRARIFRDSWRCLLLSCLVSPSTAVSCIQRCRVGCWALMPAPTERPPGARGTLRGGKMAELRLGSGILRIPGAELCFLSSSPHLRRFRVFSAAALGVGR